MLILNKRQSEKVAAAYKGVALNEHDELDLIAIHVKKQITDPHFNNRVQKDP